METQKLRIEKMRDIYCHLKVPSSVQLDSSQVEHALNTFLQRHPEVLSNILKEDYPENQKPSTQLPYISKEERDKILLSLMEESDDDSEDIDINEIKSAHNDKDDSYYNFFED